MEQENIVIETENSTQSNPRASRRKSEDAAWKRRKRRGTLIFYSFYLLFVLGILALLCCAMKPLEEWLVRFEAAQPEQASEEVFDTLFADPDWDLLYDISGTEDTEFEGKEAYIAYMAETVGTSKLTFRETSAGLSGDKKYIVLHGDEKIASFTLVSANDEDEFTTWQLSTVEVFFTRSEEVTVTVLPEQTVYINGVALDDSYIIKTVSTVAEDYLPEGTHGYSIQQLHIDGLLVQPQVTVQDADGNAVTLLGGENGEYSVEIPVPAEMGEEEYQLALDAAQANALYAIRAISAWELRSHFDPNSQVYEDISSTPVFLQSYSSYSFDDSVTAVSDFCRYSDTMFSARVTLKLDVKRNNGTIKSYEMDTTYFFTRNAAGDYLASNMTNVDTQELVTNVRISFKDETGKILSSEMVRTDAESLTLPEITVPQGYVLLGWAKQETDENGQVTMTIVLEPAEDGTAYLSDDQTLEPMTLYPVTQAAQIGEE